MKAIVVDRDYNALKTDELDRIKSAYLAAGIGFDIAHFPDEHTLIEGCSGYDIAICTGNPPFSSSVIASLPDLKIIHRTGAGVNSIDLEAATYYGKIVINLPGFCYRELADNALGLILGLIRNIGYYDRSIRKGEWPKNGYIQPPDIRNMVLGLYGFGQAGRELARIVHTAYGSEVIAYDPYFSDKKNPDYSYVDFVDFESLLCRSDIISIHVILTSETRHAFNAEAFSKMKKSAMIINTSRGPVIDQTALYSALSNNIIGYAGLDTFENEPVDPNDPLLKLDNVLLTPHSSSWGVTSKETQNRMMREIIPTAVRTGQLNSRVVANKQILKRKDLVFQFV